MDVTVAIDSVDPDRLARFWTEALGYARMRGWGPYVVLAPDRRGGATPAEGPALVLQKVPEGKVGKNRLHLDLHVPNEDAERDRLIRLGATLVQPEAVQEGEFRWWVMADPEGNEFCVCRVP
ncbi:MAG TPA: VOC family protein [Acidimicrobiia bacterium]|nr:VOC family protein [Acidimicrobiia bacterium]